MPLDTSSKASKSESESEAEAEVESESEGLSHHRLDSHQRDTTGGLNSSRRCCGICSTSCSWSLRLSRAAAVADAVRACSAAFSGSSVSSGGERGL